MLKHLFIQNYVLIEHLDIDFPEGLTIITGETGAGKTILLGALSLILGQRADSQVLSDKKKKCIIEGTFDLRGHSLQPTFTDLGVDYEEEAILRREISPDGRSRAFVNDTPVTLSQLRLLSLQLVDIHSQHESLDLNSRQFQLSVLDAATGHPGELAEYRGRYRKFVDVRRELNMCIEKESQAMKDQDYYNFQRHEIEEAALQPGEQEAAEKDLEILSHGEEIKTGIARASAALNEGEFNILSRLSEVLAVLSSPGRYSVRIKDCSERIRSAFLELKDIASELERAGEEINYDPSRISEINTRLDLINRLEQKHRVSGVGELLSVLGGLKEKLEKISSISETVSALEKESAKLRAELAVRAAEISSRRSAAVSLIEKEMKRLMEEAGLPGAAFRIELLRGNTEDPGPDGIDTVRFLFSANKGVEQREIAKASSGGELSRLMLCIKSLLAGKLSMPTLIFDEIDTGISGEVALKVGRLMKKIASSRQVVAITHLPQIAGMGDSHYFIYKTAGGERTVTMLRQLDKGERIKEIARMISGDKPSDTAMKNARELLGK